VNNQPKILKNLHFDLNNNVYSVHFTAVFLECVCAFSGLDGPLTSLSMGYENHPSYYACWHKYNV